MLQTWFDRTFDWARSTSLRAGSGGFETCGSPLNLCPLHYESTGSVLYQITNKSQGKKGQKISHRALRGHRDIIFNRGFR
jgi:hypothetical protein